MKKFLQISAFISLMFFSACHKDGVFEEAGEDVDEAVEEVKDEIDDHTEALENNEYPIETPEENPSE